MKVIFSPSPIPRNKRGMHSHICPREQCTPNPNQSLETNLEHKIVSK